MKGGEEMAGTGAGRKEKKLIHIYLLVLCERALGNNSRIRNGNHHRSAMPKKTVADADGTVKE